MLRTGPWPRPEWVGAVVSSTMRPLVTTLRVALRHVLVRSEVQLGDLPTMTVSIPANHMILGARHPFVAPRAVVLALALLASGTAHAQSISVGAGDSARLVVAPGARLAVPVRVDLSSAAPLTLASLQADVRWNSARLTFDSVRVVASTGFSQTANVASAGTGLVTFRAFSTSALSESGALTTLYFTAGATSGATRLSLTPTEGGAEDGANVLARLIPRGLDVCVASQAKWGDVNDDGAVSIIDAQQIARYSVGLSVANVDAVRGRGDVNADANVSIIDAQQIARFSVALSSSARTNTAIAQVPPVQTLTIVTPAAAVRVGQGAALSATALDSTGLSVAGCAPVVWSSSNAAVATVRNDGVLTAIGQGSTTVTVASGGRTATALITVSPLAVSSLAVAPATTSVLVGQTATLVATARDSAGLIITGRVVSWSSANAAIASVSSSGVVTAIASGSTTITATSEGVTATAAVTVGSVPVLTSISVSLSSPTIQVGQPVTATAAGRDQNGAAVATGPLTWSTDSVSVASISSSGVISTLRPGQVTVSASSGGRTGQSTLTITAGPPAALVPSVTAAITGTVGTTIATLPTVTVRDAGGFPVSNVVVAFATRGGGTVTTASTVTDSEGRASPGSWTLGTLVGAYYIDAAVGSLPTVTFTAQANAAAPAQIVVIEGANQSAVVATSVPVPPRVRVLDRFGNVVPQAAVVFSVTSGGGSVSGSQRNTGVDGEATVGSWVLGTRSGANSLRASTASVGTVAISATGTPGAPDVYSFLTGNGQIEVVGSLLPITPIVQVVDRYGNGVPSVPITFSLGNGGSIVAPQGTTDSLGFVSSGNWRIGSVEGFYPLRAIAPGFNQIGIRARGVPAPNFPVEVRYVSGGNPPQAVRDVVNASVARIRKLFVYATTPLSVTLTADSCADGQPAMSEVVTGVVVWVDIRSVDGPGGNLGSAGPCFTRLPSLVTAVGSLQLDLDDLATGLADGTALSTTVHEMLHIFGFGGRWSSQGLLSGTSTSDPWFNGSNARVAFNDAGGLSYTGNKVPVENLGGQGSRLSHWRSSLFGQEMMTAFACRGPSALSYITTSSFVDMGIRVAEYGDDDFDFTATVCTLGRMSNSSESPFTVQTRYFEESTGREVGELSIQAVLSQRRSIPVRRPFVAPDVVSRRR